MRPLEPRTEPIDPQPLPATRTQRPALVSWTDASGAHEVTIQDATTVGQSPNAGIVVEDASVSRMHAELEPRTDGVMIRDLASTNGTFVQSIRLNSGLALDNVRIRIGRVEMLVRQGAETVTAQLWKRQDFEGMLGRSAVMRALFEQMAHVAPSAETVLIQGESGTGKELVAEAIHRRSARANGPFVVLDCAGLHSNVAESELFGHAKGAFTGAAKARIGHIEAAHGGTLFLDEIGDLPADLQPKLLRAIESRQIRRVGENEYRPADVRFISASHRDLRKQVNLNRFREDLYFRLAVVPLRVPPLRERPEDIPLLIEHFLAGKKEVPAMPRDVLEELMARTWEGNVRELRNFVGLASVLGVRAALAGELQRDRPVDAGEASPPIAPESLPPDVIRAAQALIAATGTYYEVRNEWSKIAESVYIPRLMDRYKNVTDAALRAGLSSGYLRKILHRLGIKF